jgi:hypothetical protein
MIQGHDQTTLTDFKLLTLPTARQILRKFVKNEDKFKEIMELMDEECMSGFQLRDILSSNNDFESIKSSIKEQVLFNKYFNDMSSMMGIFILAEKQTLIIEEEKQRELEKSKPMPPSYDIKTLLKENDLEEAYKKVEENNVDTEAFWELDDGKIKEVLGVEAFGKRKNLLTVMAEIKKKH